MAVRLFALVRLVLAIGLVGAALAALVYPEPLWSTLVLSSTVAILFYAALASMYRVGAARARWLGIATVGWGYFLLFGPLGDESPLITTQLLDLLDEVRPQRPSDESEWEPALMPASALTALGSNAGGKIEFQIYTETNPPPKDVAPESLVPTQINPRYYDRDDFCMIGQCLWTLGLATIGGLIARRLQTSQAVGRFGDSGDLPHVVTG